MSKINQVKNLDKYFLEWEKLQDRDDEYYELRNYNNFVLARILYIFKKKRYDWWLDSIITSGNSIFSLEKINISRGKSLNLEQAKKEVDNSLSILGYKKLTKQLINLI